MPKIEFSTKNDSEEQYRKVSYDDVLKKSDDPVAEVFHFVHIRHAKYTVVLSYASHTVLFISAYLVTTYANGIRF